MELKFYTSRRVYFEWKTEPPTITQSRISPTFVFSEIEWCIALNAVYDYMYTLSSNVYLAGSVLWTMSLKTNSQISPKASKSMQLTVYRQNKNGKLDYIGVKRRDSDEIWSAQESKILHRRDDFIVDGLLTFIFVFDSPIQSIFELGMKNGPDKRVSLPQCQEQFRKDIRSLLDHSEHYDVVIVCDDQRRFYTHKCILAARSDVFAAMFRCDMSESQNGVVYIKEIDSSVLYQLLQYLYSGKVDGLTRATAVPLYTAADRYGVHCLKRKCSAMFLEDLIEEEVLGLFLLAEKYTDEELIDAVVSFVAGRKTFLRSDEWKAFSEQHPVIGTKVYQKALDLLSPP